MKICLAQIRSLKGELHTNVDHHLVWINRAVQLKADFILFPELSLINYEPELAADFASQSNEKVFEKFQAKASQYQLTIAVGMPTKAVEGVNISLLIFQPNQDMVIYSKKYLHQDEMPYFTGGSNQPIIQFKNQKIALGICYETLQKAHFLEAYQRGIDFYLASVAKSQQGIERAKNHFPMMAREYKTPVLMVNAVGDADNFKNAGQSAIWDESGHLIASLDNKNEGLLCYDTEARTCQKVGFIIEKAKREDLDDLFALINRVKADMKKNQLDQWNDDYPTREIIENDILNEDLYIIKSDDRLFGGICLNEDQEEAYQQVDWKFDPTKVLVIHRLAIDPNTQGQGMAQQLMQFAEKYAQENGFTSIRLDVYSQNPRAIAIYKNRGYEIRGAINFPGRAYHFHCMEKRV